MAGKIWGDNHLTVLNWTNFCPPIDLIIVATEPTNPFQLQISQPFQGI